MNSSKERTLTELYKKHRPKTLKGMVGNESTVQTLQNMIKRDKLPRTILLYGGSGCGKTTLGRIIAKEVNCNTEMDFFELNCSSFRGIDSIREIEKKMMRAPTGGDSRVYLLDEVHQWTKDAQNAALKMLEDTPNHVYFILCTTDPQKIIKTIKTRCCELPVELLNDTQMKKLVKRVLTREKQTMEDDLIEDLVDASEGSPRRALVMLDRVLNLPPEKREEAIKEDPEEPEVKDLCQALIKRKSWSEVSKTSEEYSDRS